MKTSFQQSDDAGLVLAASASGAEPEHVTCPMFIGAMQYDDAGAFRPERTKRDLPAVKVPGCMLAAVMIALGFWAGAGSLVYLALR